MRRKEYISTIAMKMCTIKKYANTTFKVRKRHWFVFLCHPGLLGLFNHLLFIILTSSCKYERISFQKAIASGSGKI